LKTLEKINGKGNKILGKRKRAFQPKSAHLAQPPRAPATARPLRLTGGSHLSAQACALTPSPSAPWARAVGTVLFPAPTLSLSRHPHLSAVSNLPPTISPPWTRPSPRVLRPRLCACAHFEPRALLAHLPSLICAQCLAPSPSLSLCPREPRAPPLPDDAHRLFHGCRCARAPFSATVSFALPSVTQDTLRCALSLSISSGPRSPEHLLA
jgi:hypothetical protein